MHDELPSPATLPDGHATHVVVLIAYVPAVHDVQLRLPYDDVIVPTVHVLHEVALYTYVPGVHAVHDVEPAIETLPVAHGTHDVVLGA